MIGRDPSIKPLGVGILPGQQVRGKEEYPKVNDAGYFRELTKAETGKDLRAGHELVDENEMIPLDDQIGNSFPDAIQVTLSSLTNSAFSSVPTISQIVEARFLALQLSNTIGKEPLRSNHLELGRAKPQASLQLAVAEEGGSGIKGAQGPHQDNEILSAKTRHASAKVGLDLPPITPARASADLSNLAASLSVQSPINSAPAQWATTQIADLPEVTSVQIEHVKRNSSGVLTSIELVLEPVELGRITARIQHEAGRVTLVLSAEHKHVADDLAQDSGLLLRVLGDHLPNIDRMSVHVQTATLDGATGQGQLFSDFNAQQSGSKGQGRNFADANLNVTEAIDEDILERSNTTSSRIYV